MARRIAAGNWKMNTSFAEAQTLAEGIAQGVGQVSQEVEVMVFPPFTHVASVAAKMPPRVVVGGQDCSAHDHGAYTGEVSATMLASSGARAVILGHSERRQYHHEDGGLLAQKIEQALAAKLQIIYCVGEPEAVRSQGADAAFAYIEEELKTLSGLRPEVAEKSLIVAYEPIWAIGTGNTATAAQAEAVCAFIAQWLGRQFGAQGRAVPVLYGGSCNAKNAKELFAQPHINGGLIGGASLKATDFLTIANSF